MLPTKSLVKFQCVCRAWLDYIRDPMFIRKHIQDRASKGFGFCDGTNDYNIVRIVSPSNYRNNKTHTKIEVYSLMMSSWNIIEVDYFPWEVIDARSEVLLNESIHWKAIYGDGVNDGEDIMVLLAFHLGNQSFRQLSLPHYDGDGEDLMEHLGVIKGNISLFLFHMTDWNEPCFLWVMKEYGVEDSWTKTHSIVIDPGVVIPLVFTKNDEILFEDAEHGFIVYHFDSKTSNVLGLEDDGYLNVVKYVESLVMLED
ncbi:F-box/kelch-repeat protein at3g06240 [Phtheirospermum japonicum]|uniref:F-box/kelch-repeat protein at3g06240 n=1 Tax=Phtheirospermum japonicum TaxID=374723 RepID=A0A830BJY9_9LAMI|nr:F-box/kelch-repeat protein at3g06240 [Phtheirospermum japonicum]